MEARTPRRVVGWLLGIGVLASACTGTSPAPSSTTVETTPTSLPNRVDATVAEYFTTMDRDQRLEIGALLATEINLASLSEILHSEVRFQPASPGRDRIAAPIGYNQTRQVVVRTPEGYDPTRPWPLIVLYHTWGGTADRMLDRLEMLMGEAIEEFVVAAPDDYRQTVIDAPPPVTSEHLAVWQAVRAERHIDADRTYIAGYSLGGETALTMATMHPGEMAAVVAMAAGYGIPSDVTGLWEAFLPNLRAVPILHVWGAEDSINIVGLNGRPQEMTLAQQNERLEPLLTSLDLDRYVHHRLDGVGHNGAYPPISALTEALSEERPEPPNQVHHTFRYIHQAAPHWIEGHEWLGDGWNEAWPDGKPPIDSDDETALTTQIFQLLGEIKAEITGQSIVVETTHLADFTIWLHEGMVDWSQPVTVLVNGIKVFRGHASPDPEVALAQAYRTLDFDRLRLAGIRVDVTTQTATTVTAGDEFPDVVREITLG